MHESRGHDGIVAFRSAKAAEAKENTFVHLEQSLSRLPNRFFRGAKGDYNNYQPLTIYYQLAWIVVSFVTSRS